MFEVNLEIAITYVCNRLHLQFQLVATHYRNYILHIRLLNLEEIYKSKNIECLDYKDVIL